MAQLIRIKDLSEMVLKYKTISAQKAFLTREIKALNEYYEEVKKAYANRQDGKHYGWFLGERIYKREVNFAKTNVAIVERFKRDNYN